MTVTTTIGTVVQTPRGGFWLRAGQIGAAQIVRRASRFVFLFYAARKLGPEVFGVYAVLLAIVETTSLISGEGLLDFLTREAARLPEQSRALFQRVTWLRWGYAAGLLPLTAAVIVILTHSHGQTLLYSAMMPLILFARAPVGSAQGVFRAVPRTSLLVWIEIVQAVFLLISGCVLVSLQPNLRSVVVAELTSNFAGACAAIVLVQQIRRFPLESPLPPWWEFVRTTCAFNLYPLITNIYDRVDLILIFVLAGNFATSIYAIPYRILSTLQIIPLGMTAALLPILSTPTGALNNKSLCNRMTSVLFTLSLFPVLLGTLLASPALTMTLGPSYRESAPVLQILVWAAIPMFLNFSLNTYLLAQGLEHVFLRTASVCALVNIACNLLFIPRYSFYAAAVVTILTELVLLAQNLIFIRGRFGFIPLTRELVAPSLIFASLLALSLAGISAFSPFAVASTAAAVLALYVYRRGLFRSLFSNFAIGATSGLWN